MFSGEKLQAFNKRLFIIFLIIQPLIELFSDNFGDLFTVAGISVAVVLRYALFLVISVLAIAVNIKTKTARLFIAFLFVSGIFAVLQYINLKDCNIILYEGSIQKNILQVIWYAAKYVFAVGAIFLVRLLDFGRKELKTAVLGAAAIVVSVIVVTNLFNLDYMSYGFGKADHPEGSILSWFCSDITKDNWRLFTSRGLFLTGNSLASFLTLTLPVTVYISFKDKSNLTFVLMFFQLVAMLLVSTKVSVFGAILLTVITLLIIVFGNIVRKRKFNILKWSITALIAVVFSVLFAFSPFSAMLDGIESDFYVEGENDNSALEGLDPDAKIEEISQEVKLEFVKSNFANQSIPEQYVYELYDYTEHTDFWFELIRDVDFEKRDTGRKIKVLILEDVVKTKGSVLDRLVGIGGVSVYPETDISYIYYSTGIFGVFLFLAPFILVLLATIVKILFDLFKLRFSSLTVVLTLCLGFLLFVSYFAGHTFHLAYIGVFVGVVAGMLNDTLVNDLKVRRNKND